MLSALLPKVKHVCLEIMSETSRGTAVQCLPMMETVIEVHITAYRAGASCRGQLLRSGRGVGRE